MSSKYQNGENFSQFQSTRHGFLDFPIDGLRLPEALRPHQHSPDNSLVLRRALRSLSRVSPGGEQRPGGLPADRVVDFALLAASHSFRLAEHGDSFEVDRKRAQLAVPPDVSVVRAALLDFVLRSHHELGGDGVDHLPANEAAQGLRV